jgi:probable HAF family extracellular repeat protein
MKKLFCLIILALVLTFASAAHTTTYNFSPIDYPGASGTIAYGINDAGAIVGPYYDTAGYAYGFVYKGGDFTPFNVPGAYGYTHPAGINNVGDIVGTFYYASDPDAGCHGFLYTGGTFTPLDYPGGYNTQAYGINDLGDVVGAYYDALGVHGFLYSGGSFTRIEYSGPHSTTWAVGINNNGSIVGYYENGMGEWGLLRGGFLEKDGVFTPIDVPFPNAWDTSAYGINDSGDIVGFYYEAPTVGHGFLLSGGTFTTVDYPGLTATYAYDINNSGSIVGYYNDPHGFKANPVPEPSTLLLLSAGLVGVIGVRKIRNTLLC